MLRCVAVVASAQSSDTVCCVRVGGGCETHKRPWLWLRSVCLRPRGTRHRGCEKSGLPSASLSIIIPAAARPAVSIHWLTLTRLAPARPASTFTPQPLRLCAPHYLRRAHCKALEPSTRRPQLRDPRYVPFPLSGRPIAMGLPEPDDPLGPARGQPSPNKCLITAEFSGDPLLL